MYSVTGGRVSGIRLTPDPANVFSGESGDNNVFGSDGDDMSPEAWAIAVGTNVVVPGRQIPFPPGGPRGPNGEGRRYLPHRLISPGGP